MHTHCLVVSYKFSELIFPIHTYIYRKLKPKPYSGKLAQHHYPGDLTT